MSLKMFSEDSEFIAETNNDVFAIKIWKGTDSINYFLSDEEVKDLQTLCECHLRNKAGSKVMKKLKVDCTSCDSFVRLIHIKDEGKMDIVRYCTYKDKELTAEEINDICDAYEEKD